MSAALGKTNMPKCPHCGKFTSFEKYGLNNVLERDDAKEFIKNIDNVEYTKEQKENFKKAREIYQKHKLDF